MTSGKLAAARDGILKIFTYRNWPASVQFYLGSIRDECMGHILDYVAAYNNLLQQIGGESTTGSYEFTGVAAEQFVSGMEALNNQEIDFAFNPDRFTIFIDELDRVEKDMPVNTRLGLSANDISALEWIVEIRETRE